MSGPKTLSFDNVPARDKAPAPKALAFPTQAAQVTKKPEPKPTGSPKTLFDTADTKIVSAAVEYAKQNFKNVMDTEAERIERQIRQLLPVQYESLSTWGSQTLDKGVQYTTQSAQLIKQFSSLRANELVEEALQATKGNAGGLLAKMFSKKTELVLEFKPRLVVAKTQLMQFLPKCESLLKDGSELEIRATLHMVALSAVCETAPMPQHDHTLINASQNRRVILQQAVQQYKLLVLQLESTRQQISDQLANVEQMLSITLPAFEVSNAHK